MMIEAVAISLGLFCAAIFELMRSTPTSHIKRPQRFGCPGQDYGGRGGGLASGSGAERLSPTRLHLQARNACLPPTQVFRFLGGSGLRAGSFSRRNMVIARRDQFFLKLQPLSAIMVSFSSLGGISGR